MMAGALGLLISCYHFGSVFRNAAEDERLRDHLPGLLRNSKPDTLKRLGELLAWGPFVASLVFAIWAVVNF